MSVEELSADHEEVLRDLYAAYRRPLLGFVTPMVGGDTYAAEDIVQESLIRAWQTGDRLRPEQARGWLYTVARHLVVSRYRRLRRRASEVPFDAEAQIPTAVDDLDRALESWQVVDALRSLSEDHRRVLLELYYLRRTTTEAAAALDVPVGTVKSRAHYALLALREALAEKGVISG
jgi:RNA polymerase sigma-70 factor, ECF subfamily